MITVEKHDGIAILTMAYGKVNAIDIELLQELQSRLNEIEPSDERAVILTAQGKTFSAGVDLFRLLEESADYVQRFLPCFNDTLLQLFTFPKPVVAAVNGHAIAGGCILMCAADLRLLTEDEAKVGVPELLVGLPFPSLPIEVLRSCVPPNSLQEIIYEGQNYSPKQALTVGLVDEITSSKKLMKRALKHANRLASVSPQTFQLTKRLLRRPFVERYKNLSEFDQEAVDIWSDPKQRDHVKAYLARTFEKAAKQ